MNADATQRTVSPRQYQRIVIGSSPIALIEAIYLGLKGHRCLIVDRAETIGGAWTLSDLPHFCGVELGPHYITATPAVFDFLDLLGLEIRRLAPDEQWFLGRRFLGMSDVTYDRRWIRAISSSYHENPLPQRMMLLSLFAWKLLWIELNPWARKLYMRLPSSGVPGMLSRLLALIEALGVDVWLGRELTELRIDSKCDTVVAVIDDEPIACNKVHMTSFSRLASLNVDGRSVALPKTGAAKLLQLRLVLEDPDPRAFSILGFPKGKTPVQYVADVTDRVRPQSGTSPCARILLARLQTHLPQTDETVAQVIDLLQGLGFLGPQARVLWQGWHYSDRDFRSDVDWNQLSAEIGGKIRALYSGDLGLALAQHIPRWRPVFEARLASVNTAREFALNHTAPGEVAGGRLLHKHPRGLRPGEARHRTG